MGFFNDSSMDRAYELYRKGDYGKARPLLQKLAGQGDAEGQYQLGILYAKGLGVPRDTEKAKEWLRRAAEQGHKAAQEEIDRLNSQCFITTAVCGSFGKPDGCRELTAFRSFRDNYLAAQPDGKALMDEYYIIAPRIVENINAAPGNGEVYLRIWNDYLADCLRCIDSGQFAECKDGYVRMIMDLKEEWL